MQWYERLDEKLRDYLPDMTVEHDVPMSRHPSFRIGGPARRMAFPESREQLVILLGLAEECGVQPFLLGRGTNLLVSDRGLDTLVIKTAERMTGIRRLDDVTLEADAGVLLSRQSKRFEKTAAAAAADAEDDESIDGDGIGQPSHTTEPTTPTEHPGTLADGTASVEIDFRH